MMVRLVCECRHKNKFIDEVTHYKSYRADFIFSKKSALPFLAAYINSDDVIHDINQGKREVGKTAFTQFMACMNFNYKEQLVDMVVMASANGLSAAAEFVVLGEYIKTDVGLPAANGQKYKLPAGAFF